MDNSNLNNYQNQLAPKSRWPKILIIILLLLIVAAAAAATLWQYGYLPGSDSKDINTNTMTDRITNQTNINQTVTATSPIDSDNDGLADAEEAQYGTDPQKADTDGDSYNDKQEIDSGHDPLVAYQETPIIKDCSTNIDCLIEAARICNPAKLNYSISLDMGPFGVIDTTKIYLELKKENNNCILYEKILAKEVKMSPEIREQALAAGVTEEQIAEQEKISTESTAFLIGKEMSCPFTDYNQIVDLLEKLETGTFSSTDGFPSEDCTGSLVDMTKNDVIL